VGDGAGRSAAPAGRTSPKYHGWVLHQVCVAKTTRKPAGSYAFLCNCQILEYDKTCLDFVTGSALREGGEGVEKNMGTADRVIRTIIALVILALYINGSLSGALAIILLIIAAIFIATSIVGFCPAYTLFNFSTRKK